MTIPLRHRETLVIGLILVLFGIGLTWQSWPDHQFHLWVLDVGQGDAILIQTPQDEQILIDGGPDDRVLLEMARHMPFWDHRIEHVILSHNHADHLAGLLEVARRYEIGEVWLSGAVHTTPEFTSWLEIIRDRQIPIRVVRAGDQATWGGVDLTVLHPLTDQTKILPKNQHDATIITKLTYHDFSVLLTGDIEEEHERDLLAAHCPTGPTDCPNLQSTILKVPHHGSKSGLLPDFLAAVRPKAAIISCGQGNPYGHPHPSILQRLSAAAIPTFRTDTEGTIRVDADGQVTPDT